MEFYNNGKMGFNKNENRQKRNRPKVKTQENFETKNEGPYISSNKNVDPSISAKE